ncbi:MAG: type VI secretion system contractile sheath large subunit [Deltaproteobacteria bacterium]|nr:type VI secretion system contractile sheath large subunit [Deltaproteobacteria bacterium]MBW2414160.1 type VI secretion system contractile sheath large subunit [Deltaproteobacteria bacterium]
MPFHLVLLADLAGRAPAGGDERRLRSVDRDSFDRLLAQIGPRIETQLPYAAALEIASWEDFSPDGLATRVPALAELMAARDAVGDSGAMRERLDRAGVAVELQEAGADEAAPTSQPPTGEPGDLLDSMLEGAQTRPGAPRRRYADRELDDLISQIADDSASDVDFASQDRWREAIDREIEERVRAVLHDPAFRRVESAWTGLRELLRSGDTDDAVRVEVLALTREELLEESLSGELERTLHGERAETRGAPGIDLVIADFDLGDRDEDRAAVSRLGALANRGKWPVLVGADASLSAPDRQPSPEFEELRQSAEAKRVALCCPRVLLRLPYGRDTVPADRFDFEETPGESEPDYTWASAAPVVGRAVVRAITAEGGLEGITRHAGIGGLPVHVYRAQGETRSRHPVEHVMTETLLKELVARGLLPLAGVVASDEAQLVSLRTLGGTSLLEARSS